MNSCPWAYWRPPRSCAALLQNRIDDAQILKDLERSRVEYSGPAMRVDPRRLVDNAHGNPMPGQFTCHGQSRRAPADDENGRLSVTHTREINLSMVLGKRAFSIQHSAAKTASRWLRAHVKRGMHEYHGILTLSSESVELNTECLGC